MGIRHWAWVGYYPFSFFLQSYDKEKPVLFFVYNPMDLLPIRISYMDRRKSHYEYQDNDNEMK
jgi:hypothetical protein